MYFLRAALWYIYLKGLQQDGDIKLTYPRVAALWLYYLIITTRGWCEYLIL